jgi:hypothetical protein
MRRQKGGERQEGQKGFCPSSTYLPFLPYSVASTISYVSMLALAGGLAFGLGGRDRASKFIERWGNEMHH